MEVLDRYNLADMAALGTIANQHAFLAYKRTLAQNPNATDLSQLLDETAKRDVQKAIEYLNKTAPFIDSVLLGEDATQDIPERDVLVGLNQYASATAYLYTLKVNSFSKNTYVNIFPVALSYSERYVPELHAFTALSYATALNISNTGSVDDFEFALRPITSFNIASAKSGSVIWKIINSKNNTSISAYGGPNIKGIAAKSPSFKDWLVSAGWTEEDFK
jgi:hypothetical protein